MKKFLLILLLSLCFFNIKMTVNAQESPEDIMDYFFTVFKNDTGKAIEYIFSTNPQIDPKQQGINSIKEGLETHRKLLGNYYGYDLASKYYVGTVYAKYSYVLKYERQPVKIVVVFYKPSNKWKVQSMNLYSDVEGDLKLVE